MKKPFYYDVRPGNLVILFYNSGCADEMFLVVEIPKRRHHRAEALLLSPSGELVRERYNDLIPI